MKIEHNAVSRIVRDQRLPGKEKKKYCELLYVRVLTWCSNAHVCLHAHLNAGAHRGRKEGIGPPGLGATSSCELTDMGTSNLTQVLCKNSKGSFFTAESSLQLYTECSLTGGPLSRAAGLCAPCSQRDGTV